MRRNEKPCVCNVFATPHSKNPVKSSVLSYANVNLLRSGNEEKHRFFWLSQFQKELSTPQNFGFGEFFALLGQNLVLFCIVEFFIDPKNETLKNK